MRMTTTRRKPRKDCNYVIYKIADQEGNTYIGLTRKTESTPLKSVKRRWGKHISRAKCDKAIEWALYQHIRLVGYDAKWKHEILEIIRGRKEAYARERQIIMDKKPNLNEQYLVYKSAESV